MSRVAVDARSPKPRDPGRYDPKAPVRTARNLTNVARTQVLRLIGGANDDAASILYEV